MKQHVYVMQSGSGLVKIGVSATPEVRRAAIQTGSGFTVEIVKLFGPFNAATSVESSAHTLLSPARRLGEWFACSAAEAVAAVERALETHIDPADMSEEEQLKRTQELIACFEEMARRSYSPIHEFARSLLDSHEDLVNRYSALSAEHLEAAELVEFYAKEVDQWRGMNKALLDRVRALEAQLRAR